MIENEINTQKQEGVVNTSAATSPITRSYSKKRTKKNAFLAWLRDEDNITDHNDKISAKAALISFAKGLIEIVKTVYKRPLLSALTISLGVVLTVVAQYSALTAVMTLSIVAGSASILYSIYSIVSNKTNMDKKQAYELMGISTFVLAIGIYGLLL